MVSFVSSFRFLSLFGGGVVRHGVLNLTHTVGITQNFCNERNFDQVWRETRKGRKLMAAKWMNQLDVHYPHLGQRARLLNEQDNFTMKHNPAEVKLHDEARARARKLINAADERRRETSSSSSSSSSSSTSHRSSLQEQHPSREGDTRKPRRQDVTIENSAMVKVSADKIRDSRTETTSDDSDVMSSEIH